MRGAKIVYKIVKANFKATFFFWSCRTRNRSSTNDNICTKNDNIYPKNDNRSCF